MDIIPEVHGDQYIIHISSTDIRDARVVSKTFLEQNP